MHLSSNGVRSEHHARTVQYSLVDLLAGVVTVAPALALALTGAAALPGVLAFAGSEPVLRFVDIAVDHELS